MKKIELKGVFHLVNFSVTFGLLLIRNVEYDFDELKPRNTDIIFGGVLYMELDTIFEDITISQGDNDGVEYFRQRSLHESIDPENIFTLESQGKKFYIVAREVFIENNDFDFDKTSLKPKWRNIDYEANTPKSIFKINTTSNKENAFPQEYFDIDYFVEITIKFDFNEIRADSVDLLHRNLLFQHFKERNEPNLIVRTYQHELSYFCVITCGNKDFSEIFNTSLNLLLKDTSYNLVEYDSYSTKLINQISYSLFLDYRHKGASLKITNNQLKKYKMLTGTDISFHSKTSHLSHYEGLGGYLQMYFIAKDAETTLRKIEESWNFLLSKKYLKIQQTEFHVFQDTNEAFFAISIKKEFLSPDSQYSDIYSFLDVHNLLLSENNIETYLVLLHRFDGIENTLPERFSNAHLVIVKSSTPTCPSFLDIYHSFI